MPQDSLIPPIPRSAVGMLVGALWLSVMGGCRVVDGKAAREDRSRVAATPQRGSVLPAPEGTSDLSDASILPKGSGRRHVIIMIGDGMQLAHEIATSRYLYGTDRGLSFHAFPEQSYVTTWDVTVYDARASALGLPPYSPESFDPKVGYDPSIGGAAPYPVVEDNAQSWAYFVSGIYPDSASTATAMSTGVKTYSAAIAWRPNGGDNGALETSSQFLRRVYGMSIGFVTTAPFSHATPAGFFAHNQSRANYTAIAHELLTIIRPEVMIGGAWGDYAYYVTADHANSYMRFVRPLYQGDLPTQLDATYPEGEITYGTGTHTMELVMLYVKGYAATKIHDYESPYPGFGIIDNTSLYRITLDAARR